jgi:SNF2 family DNA or RNA helicase
MADVRIARGTEWDSIAIAIEQDDTLLAASVGQIVMAAGGEPQGKGFLLTTFGLLRSARELGVAIKQRDASVEYDESVRAMLAEYVGELEAREGAPDLKPVAEEEVRRLLEIGRFVRKLTDAQMANVCRLLALKHGANFSVPGAGKTATLLAIFAALRAKDSVEKLLVVAPKNAMIAWEDEIDACFGDDVFRCRRLSGGQAGVAAALEDDPDICFITYQLLPNVARTVGEWAHRNKAHVVLDESHRVKRGMIGVTARAALHLSASSRRRDILSGTPLPQSTEDLRPQFDFLWPGQRILPEPSTTSPSDSDLAEIQDRVGSLYVRTTKKELGLTPPIVERVPVSLGPIQRELYELLRSEAKRRASGMSAVDRAFLRRLGRHVVRLIEAASNPILLTQGVMLEDDDGQDDASSQVSVRAFDLIREFAKREKPAKIVTATSLVRKSLSADGKAKVVLWTTFIQNIHTLAGLLQEFHPVVLYGDVATGDEDDPETREGRIRQFHRDPSCRVMVANPAACGEGISLHTVCHHAIYVDRTFNAAHFLQSIDRIHRLGLRPDQETRVSILEATTTVDARIATRLKSKIEVMSAILNDPELAALAYDPEDVEELFPAGVEAADVEEIVEHLTGNDKE